MPKDTKTIPSNPYVEEPGFAKPIIILNENGYSKTYTDSKGDQHILTHLGFKDYEKFDSYDNTTARAELSKVRGDVDALKEYISKTEKPLVNTDEILDLIVKQTLKKEASAIAMGKNDGHKSEPVTAGTQAKPTKKPSKVSADADYSDYPEGVNGSESVKNKNEAGTTEESAYVDYKTKLSVLEEDVGKTGELGKIFGYESLRKFSLIKDIKEAFERVFGGSSDAPKNDDNHNKHDL